MHSNKNIINYFKEEFAYTLKRFRVFVFLIYTKAQSFILRFAGLNNKRDVQNAKCFKTKN